MVHKDPNEVLEAYKAAVYAKDVEAFVALYDQDVRIFDLWGKWIYEGAQAWREMATGWFSSLGKDLVAVEMDDVKTIHSGDTAVIHAFVTYKGVSAEGTVLRAMQDRHTWVFRQRDGAWRIVHEHSSAPVDLETMKVILQR
jgi:uncharacterized protein (TIGR02246 family)